MIVCQSSFVDRVSGKPVYDCIDVFGRMWHANGAWSFFRNRKGEDWRLEVECRAEEQRFLNSEGRSGSLLELGGD